MHHASNTCPHRKVCTGCSLIGLTYEQQLFKKTTALKAVLSPLKGLWPHPHDEEFPFPLLPIIPSSAPWGYRISTKLVLGEDSFGARKIGLFQKNSKILADIPECPVHHPTINKVLRGLFGPTRDDIPAPFYRHDIRSFQPGKLKFIVIRHDASLSHRSLGLILVHTGVDKKLLRHWAEGMDLSDTALYEATLSPHDESLVIPRKMEHLAGQKTMDISLGDQRVSVHPAVFFQANGPMTATFVNLITQAFKRQPRRKGRRLLDLYGGFGSYSFSCKHIFDHIWLVEAHPEAIAAALEQQKREKEVPITPLAMTVERFFETDIPWETITDCVVNPPRSGLGHEACRALAQKIKAVENFVYVSCNPETMVADLKILSRYLPLTPVSFQPIDMFPQTEHLECVAIFRRSPI